MDPSNSEDAGIGKTVGTGGKSHSASALAGARTVEAHPVMRTAAINGRTWSAMHRREAIHRPLPGQHPMYT